MKRTSIRLRLMVIMICLTTLPVIAVTLIAVNNTINSVEKEIISANNSRMLWADQYLNELMRQVESSFYTLQTDKQLMGSLSGIDNPDTGIQFTAQTYITNTLYSVFNTNSRKIDDLTLYVHLNRKTFSVSFATSVRISSLDIKSRLWKRMLERPENMYFKQSGQDIHAFHSLNRYQDQKLLGGISVCINRDIWAGVGDILKSEPESSVFIVNDEGEILTGSSPMDHSSEINEQLQNLSKKNSDLEFYKTKKYFFFRKRIDDGQLFVLKVIPTETVMRSARNTFTAGILIGILFALISVLLSVLVSLRISRPIISLAKTMRTAQISDFKEKPVQSRDEIGLLEHGYNVMMQRIKELIDVEYRKNIELKNAQLAAMQAQINPHFLNNTLHMIGGIALAKNAPEIYQITRAIGSLLRYAISSDGDMVALESELEHMKNYLFIQENRFLGRCTVTISCDKSVLAGRIPKFTLQPIVENAFEHGLQKKEGTWKIDIRIKRLGKRIGLFIKDNGVGIQREHLEVIRSGLQSSVSSMTDRTGVNGEKKRGGIGLRNVNARLKLHFGSMYGARVFSSPGAGTLVVLVLPVSDKEVAEDV